jgi:3-phosphoshikimate 1-carboxyvinyltransferase
MNVRIIKPVQGGKVQAVTSKSAAHRLLICAALAQEETFVSCPERSEDIDATARCLQAIGADIRYEKDGFLVKEGTRDKGMGNSDAAVEHSLDCGESGSTLRFLLPVCGALGLRTSFNMKGQLPKRPLSGLYEEMQTHGCNLSAPGSSPLNCEGQLKSGEYTLPGNISSQFISGLLFALPLLEGDSVIRVTDGLESRPYIDMTLEALKLFGIKIEESELPVPHSPSPSVPQSPIFHIPGSQTYVSPGPVRAEGDWSNAAFWLSAGAIGAGSISCTGLKQDSCQGDQAIAALLARFGAHISYDRDNVTVSPGTLRGIDIDAKDTPDLVPVLAAVASVAEGETIIRNARRLRLKESDRLRTVAASLSSLGADVVETEDGLVIHGKKTLPGGETESFGDHRIAMTVAALSAACTGPVVIRNAEAVKKSYPGFFDDFNSALGGVWKEG